MNLATLHIFTVLLGNLRNRVILQKLHSWLLTALQRLQSGTNQKLFLLNKYLILLIKQVNLNSHLQNSELYQLHWRKLQLV